jgi:hypothetical protein
MFLDSTFVPLMIHRHSDDWFAKNGLVESIYGILIALSFTEPLTKLINAHILINKIKIIWYRWSCG